MLCAGKPRKRTWRTTQIQLGLGIVLISLGLPLLLSSPAQAGCGGPCSKEQLTTGLANPPAWAKGKAIHFEPPSIAASAYSYEELEEEGLAGDGPILYREWEIVQHAPSVKVIYWGSNFINTEKGVEVRSMLQNLFGGMSGSAYQGILTQYFDSTGRIPTSISSSEYVDGESVAAPENVNLKRIEEEVTGLVNSHGWPINSSSLYLLVTAPGSTYEEAFTSSRGCAFHSVVKNIVYGFVPFQGDPPYGTGGCVETGNPSKNPVYKTSKSASHEYAEAATDPLVSASWTNITFSEIADICNFAADVELPSGAYAQNLYDDHLNGCATADAEPPRAYANTEAATEVKATEVTLKGKVNPENSASNYYFEYGLSSSYGSKTAEVSAGSGITNVTASKTLTGLEPSTTYHFRVVETNETGSTAGIDKKVTTPPLPPTVTTTSATGITATEAILHGDVNPNGYATTTQFEYGTSSSYGSAAPVPAESAGSGTETVQKGVVLTGLAPGTTYYFRLKGTSGQGSANGEGLTFTTASLTPAFSANYGSSGTTAGKFTQPTGIAVSPINGNVVVPDEGNNRVQVLNEKGESFLQFGSLGSGNGQFNQPRGAAVDRQGNIWIVDTANNRVQKFNEKGEYLSQFGAKGTGNGQLTSPKNLAVDSEGNVWVADSGNKRVQKFTEKGEYVCQFSAGTNPIGVAIDSAGNVWSDNENTTGVIEEHNSSCGFIQSFVNRGSETGQLLEPKRLAVDANGYIWVPDAGNYRVQVFGPKGEYVTKFGSIGPGAEQMSYPSGVAVDPRGSVWVDDNNNRIDRWKLPSPWPPTFSANYGSSGTTAGKFTQPTGIAVSPINGNVVVPDEGNNRVQVLNEKGESFLQFGSLGSGNGQFNQPRGAAVDLQGNIWVVDTGNNRVQKFSEKGEYLSQFGTKGTGNGQFTSPKNVAVDSKGNVWVADSGNKRVQKFNEKGEYVCQFSAGTNPIGVSIDSAGNVWSDNENTTGVIEEHNSSCGFIQSFVNHGSETGQLLEPRRLAIDANGYIWVPDEGTNRVEVFGPKGEYVSKFGSGGLGAEQMLFPSGVAVDPRGSVWVDDDANRIDRWAR